MFLIQVGVFIIHQKGWVLEAIQYLHQPHLIMLIFRINAMSDVNKW